VASTIRTIIETLFTTRGADAAEGATDRVGRAQTRLGQTSASAGRSFAAQASGMGGLVGAYAGAAATVIALSSAYSALTKAAQAKQTLEGLNALAAGSAVSGERLLASVQKITKGQLALSESAGNINLALSAGFSGKQIEGLSSVALKASRALGRDLTDSMTRVVRGSAKMEAELLDELGIYTKIGPATRAYASALGVSVGSLTEFQRRQAFANAVIAEGQRKFSSISTIVPTTSEQLQAFAANISNVTTQITMFIADALAPLASFLTTNLGASFGAVGLAATLVFSKALSLLQTQIKTFGDGVDAFATRLSDRILKAGSLTTQKLGAARTAVAGISGNAKGTKDIGTDLAELKKIAGERNLNTQELAKANTVLNKRIDNLKGLRTAEMAQVAALKAQRASLTAGTQAYIDNEKAIAGVYKRIQVSNKLLTTTRAELDAVAAAANTSAGRLANASSVLVKGFGGSITGVAKLSLGIVSLAAKAISLISILGIVGSAIANVMGKGDEFNALVKKLGSAISGLFTSSARTNAKNVFQGLTASILTSLEATDAGLKNIDSFTFKTKFLWVSVDVEKTKQQIVNDVASVMADLATGNKMQLGDALMTQETGITAAAGALAGGFIGTFFGGIGAVPGVVVGAAVGAIGAALTAAFTQVGNAKYTPSDETAALVTNKFKDQLAGYDTATKKQLTVALAYFQDQYGELAKMDPVARSMLDTYSQLVIENGKYSKDVFIISDTMKAIGKDASVASKNFQFKTGIDNIEYLASATAKIGEESIVFKNFDIDTDAVRATLATASTLPMKLDLLVSPNIADADRAKLDEFLYSLNERVSSGMDQNTAIQQTLTQYQQAYPEALQFLNTIRSGVAALGTVGNQLSSLFNTTHGTISTVQNDLMLVTELLVETDQGVKNNSLSFDQYTQNISNATATQAAAYLELIDARDQFNKLKDTQSGFREGSAMWDLVAAEEARLKAAEAVYEANNRILALNKAQTNEFQKRKEIEDYLLSITPKSVSAVELGAKVAVAGSGNELQTQIQYAYATVAANKEAISSYNELSKTLNTLPIQDTQKVGALSATSYEDLQKALNNSVISVQKLNDGTVIAYNGVTHMNTAITGLGTETAKAADTGNKAMTALSGLMQTLAVDTAKFINNKLVDYKKLVTDAEQTIKQISAKSIIVRAKFEIDSQDLSDKLAMSIEEFKLKKLQLDVNLIEAKKENKVIKPVEAAKQINGKQQDIIAQQKVILDQQFQNDMAKTIREDDLMKKQAALSKSDIDAKTKLITDQIDRDSKFISSSAKLYSDFISQQHDVSQGFITSYVDASNGMIDRLVSALSTGAAAIGESIRTQGVSTGTVTGGDVITVDPLKAVGTALTDMSREALIGAYNAKAAIQASAEAEKSAIDTDLQNSLVLSAQKRSQLQSDHDNETTLAAERAQIEDENAKKRIADAEKEGKAKDKLQNRMKEMFDSFKGSFESAFSSLYDLALTGEGTVKDIIGSLFKSIAEEVYKQTIATPISNMLSGWITGGLKTALGGKDILGSPLQGVVGSAAGATGDALLKNTIGDKAVDQGAKAIGDIGKKMSAAVTGTTAALNGAASAGAAAISTTGTTLATTTTTSTGVVATANTAGATTLMSSLGPILAVLAVIAAIVAIFGGKKKSGNSGTLARADAAGVSHTAANEQSIMSGSVPQMASGGMLRDRVSARLEPGEFVIRKPIARKIGATNLAAMNATGNTGNNSAPVINIKNEGTQKDAQASPPRFDGDKYVIDIIMRDLSNNGPIRRSLRGGI